MGKTSKLLVALMAVGLLGGCVHSSKHSHTHKVSTQQEDSIVINVTGYGAPKSTYENIAQRRLMALRASELDAYKKLGEQIAGVHVYGDTSVENYIAGRDRVRTRLYAFIRGAAITNQEFQSDGIAITNMSLKVEPSMLRHMLEHDLEHPNRGGGLITGSAFDDGHAFTTTR